MKALRPRRLGGERGVAMVVVLLVASVMTVVASSATFVAIQEFQSSSDDSEASRALAIAEAGVDRMIQAIGAVTWEWGTLMKAGCTVDGTPQPAATLQGQVTGGTFSVSMTRIPSQCPSSSSQVPKPFEPQRLQIISQGTTGTGVGDANRRIEQIIRVVAGGLPIGVFAYNRVSISGSGTGTFRNISLITPGNIDSRDKIETLGFDVWLSQDDFYGNGNTGVCDTLNFGACNPTNSLPAAVHAGGDITCDANSTCGAGSNKTEHVPPAPGIAGQEDLNCTANVGPKNSAWDGSRNGGPINSGWNCPSPNLGKAPTSLFTASQAQNLAPQPQLTEKDYAALEDAAKSDGIYCNMVANKINCTKLGASLCTNCGTLSSSDLSGLPKNYVIFGDFPVSNALPSALPSLKIGANTNMSTCNLDSTLSRSAAVVVRYGGFELGGGGHLAGVVIAPEGLVDVGGSASIHGSIIAKELLFRGSSDFLMDACSLNNLTVPFITVTAEGWREVDR